MNLADSKTFIPCTTDDVIARKEGTENLCNYLSADNFFAVNVRNELPADDYSAENVRS